MTDEEEEAIKYYKNKDTSFSVEFESKMSEDKFYEMLGITKEDTFEKHQIRFQTLLNLIEKQDNTIKGNECVIETMAHNEEVLLETIEKKDKIIDDTIIAVENLRQYFSEDLQPDFIIILEILKNKKVIDW